MGCLFTHTRHNLYKRRPVVQRHLTINNAVGSSAKGIVIASSTYWEVSLCLDTSLITVLCPFQALPHNLRSR